MDHCLLLPPLVPPPLMPLVRPLLLLQYPLLPCHRLQLNLYLPFHNRRMLPCFPKDWVDYIRLCERTHRIISLELSLLLICCWVENASSSLMRT